MKLVLDKLCSFSKGYLADQSSRYLALEVDEFRALLWQEFMVVLKTAPGDMSPIELADRLLAAFPEDHPAYQDDALTKLRLIYDIYERLELAKGEEGYRFVEFYQAFETTLVDKKRLKLTSRWIDYKQRLEEVINDRLEHNRISALPAKGASEEMALMLNCGDYYDRVTELRIHDLEFRLIMAKYDAVVDLLGELQSNKPSYQAFPEYERKLAWYQAALSKEFITTGYMSFFGGAWRRASGAAGYALSAVWPSAWSTKVTAPESEPQIVLPVVEPTPAATPSYWSRLMGAR